MTAYALFMYVQWSEATPEPPSGPPAPPPPAPPHPSPSPSPGPDHLLVTQDNWSAVLSSGSSGAEAGEVLSSFTDNDWDTWRVSSWTDTSSGEGGLSKCVIFNLYSFYGRSRFIKRFLSVDDGSYHHRHAKVR
jgi:hypothetical protein